jgi:16S rRNA (cytosine967-C5)-methyltransferase
VQTKDARELASDILVKVEIRKAYADLLLDDALTKYSLSHRDRALLTEVVYGVLRWRGKIDFLLVPHLRRGLHNIDPLIRNLLRVAVYQLEFLDKIPDYAAVNGAVEIAKQRSGIKTSGLVNAVLRNVLRAPKRRDQGGPAANVAQLAAELSHPEWLIEKWAESFGLQDAKDLLRANNERPPLILRVNSLRIDREKFLRRLESAGISAAPSRWSSDGVRIGSGPTVENLPGFEEGLFQVQGESSQLIAYLLAPAPGERVLDCCAAPGGKTTHMAELMSDKGEIVAVDISKRGVQRISANCSRLGLRSVRAVEADLREQLGDELSRPYDRVLLDAPCSGLGTLRGHPEIKWHRNESDIRRLASLQKHLIGRAADYVKPGGAMVYSTCTVTAEENERMIEGFLTRRKDFSLENAADYLSGESANLVRGSYLLTLPHRHDTDGFFAARLRRAA